MNGPRDLCSSYIVGDCFCTIKCQTKIETMRNKTRMARRDRAIEYLNKRPRLIEAKTILVMVFVLVLVGTCLAVSQ
jgi:hypothetical protein